MHIINMYGTNSNVHVGTVNGNTEQPNETMWNHMHP